MRQPTCHAGSKSRCTCRRQAAMTASTSVSLTMVEWLTHITLGFSPAMPVLLPMPCVFGLLLELTRVDHGGIVRDNENQLTPRPNNLPRDRDRDDGRATRRQDEVRRTRPDDLTRCWSNGRDQRDLLAVPRYRSGLNCDARLESELLSIPGDSTRLHVERRDKTNGLTIPGDRACRGGDTRLEANRLPVPRHRSCGRREEGCEADGRASPGDEASRVDVYRDVASDRIEYAGEDPGVASVPPTLLALRVVSRRPVRDPGGRIYRTISTRSVDDIRHELLVPDEVNPVGRCGPSPPVPDDQPRRDEQLKGVVIPSPDDARPDVRRKR